MVVKLLKKFFGSRNERLVKQLDRVVERISALEPSVAALSDAALAEKTAEFRQRFAAGETLDQLLPEAFAVVREAGKRVLSMRHFNVQLVGGMVLHSGKIAEMRTGEGKTLVATLAVYLNAIPGKGVHIVTVNDYLARRDADWMGKIYRFLGLTVGVVVNDMSHQEKADAYRADITYGTNNEFGFDYLRDNMASSQEERVQRELNFAVIDEVDSILIDEARTPLIISGPTDESSDLYGKIDSLVPPLVRQEKELDPTDPHAEETGDYTVDEKHKQVYLTERGHQKVEGLMVDASLLDSQSSLYDTANIGLMHHLIAALRAHTLYHRNVDYIVRNGQVVIVDEFTGRTLQGRRWSDGLHQAVEAKEGVHIEAENQTLASITFQNYFRLYKKISGMTGTADTEAFEFSHIYGLEVVVIPTNLPMIRKDFNDLVYVGIEDKMQAVVEDIKDCHARRQPVLVGTTSIEMSETISALLKKQEIKHEVLNAKHHEREAEIIAQAGAPAAVTIATNMAGRGTDIVLGGNFEVELKTLAAESPEAIEQARDAWKLRHQAVLDAGGLHIVGTERHESRRIDNQLRGRAGRQGDPGSSRFYLSLKDNLMRIFASEWVSSMMQRLGMLPGEPIEHPLVNKAILRAQRKVEAYNFDVRKNLLDYDDVANDQRKFIYAQRQQLMQLDSISSRIQEMRVEVLNTLISSFIPPNSFEEQWNTEGLEEALKTEFGVSLPIKNLLQEDSTLNEEGLRRLINDVLAQDYERKVADVARNLDPGTMQKIEKAIFLHQLDRHWKEHLASMDYLRQGIHLEGYGQKNPKQEYKKRAFQMFRDLLDRIQLDVIRTLSKGNVVQEEEHIEEETKARDSHHYVYQHAQAPDLNPMADPNADPMEAPAEAAQPYVRDGRKVGRNEFCPCGSGKKFKQCHGKIG